MDTGVDDLMVKIIKLEEELEWMTYSRDTYQHVVRMHVEESGRLAELLVDYHEVVSRFKRQATSLSDARYNRTISSYEHRAELAKKEMDAYVERAKERKEKEQIK